MEILELTSLDGKHMTDLKNKKEKPNLPQEEEVALKKLMEAKYIVIKPADKGSGV